MMMTRRGVLLSTVAAALCAAPLLAQPAAPNVQPNAVVATGLRTKPATGAERARFLEAARTAWQYIDAHYQPKTGMVSSVSSWHFATTWDIGSTMAAYFSALHLGLIDRADFDRRMKALFATLKNMKYFHDIAPNKLYGTKGGGIVDGRGEYAPNGSSVTTTDLGRLLVWLKIIAENDSLYTRPAQEIVNRIRFDQLIRDGYLYGIDDYRGKLAPYQEGRLGYEQYAAAGFALWGKRAENALNLGLNARPVEVMGHEILVDKRGGNLITSEPYILYGLELGWTPELLEQAKRLLAIQEARYRKTGRVTIASEDAIEYPPHYFFYYLIYGGKGDEFAVQVQSRTNPLKKGPRVVSTKATWAWHALLPGDYTSTALERIASARTPRGWSTGVFEESGTSARTENINTAGVVLEAAHYAAIGKPLLYATYDPPSGWK